MGTKSATGITFMRLPAVEAATGLRKSEIYRRIAAGTFPASRKYPGTQRSFWRSDEVRAWQDRILLATERQGGAALGVEAVDEFEQLLSGDEG